ncbi:P-loop containing nucleoside triphosphate hydrolase protein [Lactarius psammicola]|nr:P-loop containing nucleoside triphosphate hydrolase protein [Lactarius psammicola]
MGAVSIIIEHILVHLPDPCPSQSSSSSPLFVALQGPQGSGKTFLTGHIKNSLSCPDERHPALRVATLSIDDLYLPHTQLMAVASSNPENVLLHGRGQPGTHDIALGLSLLRSLKDINRSPTSHLRIPRFDKSLFGDVVLLEGWCVGFYPQSRQYIGRRINQVPLGLEPTFDVSAYTLEHILDSTQSGGDLFDVFVQIAPPIESPYVHIYKWRLEQEHAMKATTGGKGMTDEQVKKFVDRYIPGYHFFGAGVVTGGHDPQTGSRLFPPWLPNGETPDSPLKFLRITIDENREVLDVSTR